MNRVVPLLLLVLAGCRRDEAVQAIIQLDPALKASCVALEVTDSNAQVLDSKALPYSTDHLELRVAVFRGELPADVQLQVRALWGTGCTEPLAYNGLSAPVSAHFAAGTQKVSLTLSPPGPDEDADGDGFVAASKKGPDCDDAQAERKPGREEMCDASTDLNCDGLRGCDDATCANRECSRFPTSLNFTPATLPATAGQCAPVTVERRDSTGALNKPGFATPLTLTNALPPGVEFFSDSSCSSSRAPPTEIPASVSGVTFYVKGKKVGSGSLSAAASMLTSASFTYTLSPGPLTQLAFTSPVPASQAGYCYAVALKASDAFDNPVSTPLASVSITPAPATPAQAAFYKDPGCTQLLDPTTLPTASSQSFYFRATLATKFALQAKSSGTNVLSAPQNWTIQPRPTSKISYTPTSSPPLLAGQCSAPVRVKLLDEYDNLSPLATSQVLTVTTTPPDTGFESFLGSGCVAAAKLPGTITPQACTDPQLCAQIDISFKAKVGGSVEIKTSGPGLTEVKQTQVIIPTVRRGTCRMEVGDTAKSCNINEASYSTAQVDTSRAFVVFQATSDNNTPGTSFIRCALTASTIECKRNTATAIAPATATAVIQWQVVELPQGLSVRHLPDTACATTPITLNPAADTPSTFVLFSSSQDGESVDANDFATIQLASSTQLSIQPNCGGNQLFDFQLVQFSGSQVTRNSSGPMASDSYSVSTTAADPSHTLLLSTWQTNGTSGSMDIYKHLVRAEIDTNSAPPNLRFFRGVDTTINTSDIPLVAWERITLPAALVQPVRLSVLDGESTKSATLATPVDPTRTLLLTSSQLVGQGMGETSYGGDDTLGVAIGRLLLTDSTHLSVTRDSPHGKTTWTAYAIQFEP